MARESKRPRERYATVARRMWNDEVFRSWSAPAPNAQTLWQYILTSPDAGSIPGLFRFSVAATAERFGWSIEDTRRCLDEIVDAGRAEYDNKSQLLFLPNALRWNMPESPNVVRGWWRQWSELPECALKVRAARSFTRELGEVSEPMATAFASVQRGASGQLGEGQSRGRVAAESRQSGVRVASKTNQNAVEVEANPPGQDSESAEIPAQVGKDPQLLPRRNRGSIPDSGSEDQRIRGQEIPPKPPQGGAVPSAPRLRLTAKPWYAGGDS